MISQSEVDSKVIPPSEILLSPSEVELEHPQVVRDAGHGHPQPPQRVRPAPHAAKDRANHQSATRATYVSCIWKMHVVLPEADYKTYPPSPQGM